MTYRVMTAEEAAEFIKHGEVIGASGFTPSGYPKAIPVALAKKAEKLHSEGKDFKIALYTGASTGDELDGTLARANAISKRMPYQSNKDLRNNINRGDTEFIDVHLSHMAQYVRYGFFEKVTTAIVEAVEVTDDGKIYLTMSGGVSATYLQQADKIFVEVNRSCPEELKEMQDVYVPLNPPNRQPIPIVSVGDKVGTPYVQVDPNKIVGIVYTDTPDASPDLRDPGADEIAIAEHVIDFLVHEKKMGRLPNGLPYQSGVGNVANAVLSCFANAPGFDKIDLYTEVIQDSIFQLIDSGRLGTASTCSLTLSKDGNERFCREISQLKDKFVIRQQEISNNPEVVRRLGVIAMNTALEMDIFGNVNSTNVLGSKMMNGIGGSADFCRNAYLSFFMTPSIAKGGDISSIVPMVSHFDHSEHSVQVMVTEQGIADLRGLSPKEKTKQIIDNCVHPDYKDIFRDVVRYGKENAPASHTPIVLDKAFEFHKRFAETGSMKIK